MTRLEWTEDISRDEIVYKLCIKKEDLDPSKFSDIELKIISTLNDDKLSIADRFMALEVIIRRIQIRLREKEVGKAKNPKGKKVST